MTVQRSRADGGMAFAVVIVLVALNLRAFLTSSSPLLAPIRQATGIGFHAVALLTVLPMFAMGAMSLFGAESASASARAPASPAGWRPSRSPAPAATLPAALPRCCGAPRSPAPAWAWCKR